MENIASFIRLSNGELLQVSEITLVRPFLTKELYYVHDYKIVSEDYKNSRGVQQVQGPMIIIDTKNSGQFIVNGAAARMLYDHICAWSSFDSLKYG